MLIQSVPDTLTQLTQMGDVTLYEPAGDNPSAERKPRSIMPDLSHCISHVATPQGSKPILKTMVTTACERNCYYCPFRAGRSSTKRVTFVPDALASAFDTMQRAKQVDGLFLSSGIIKGSVTTQDKIIDTIEIVRRKYRYRGYVHLKIYAWDRARPALSRHAVGRPHLGESGRPHPGAFKRAGPEKRL